MNEILRIEHLDFSYHQEKIIYDVTFSLFQGEILTILGPNGAGKSTLLNCITHLLPYQKGNVFIKGKNSNDLTNLERSKMIGYVPQTIDLKYDYTVEDYVLMGRTPYISTFHQPSLKDYQIVQDKLHMMSILHLKNRSVMEISGGELQKAMIAKALVQIPSLIILDEPTSALDIGNQMKVMRLTKKLAQEGYTVILTTHNPDHAILLDDKVGMIDANGSFHFGNASDIITSEKLTSTFRTNIVLEYNNTLRRNICLTKL